MAFKVNRAELVLEMLRDDSVTARDVMQASKVFKWPRSEISIKHPFQCNRKWSQGESSPFAPGLG